MTMAVYLVLNFAWPVDGIIFPSPMSVMVITEMIYLPHMSAYTWKWMQAIHTHVYRYTSLRHPHIASDEDSLQAGHQSRMDGVKSYE